MKTKFGRFVQAASITGAVIFTIGAAQASTITVAYTVEAEFGVAGFSASPVSATVSDGSDSNTLTLTYSPQEPVPPAVVVPTNTAFGSLYLDVSGLPSSGTDVFNLAGVVLTERLYDSATGLFVTDVGTLSGSITVNTLEQASSSGLITWSVGSATQFVASPSIVFFTTDASDPVGTKLDGDSGVPTLVNPATTVNGTVNAFAVPEPATFSLVGGALLGLGLLGRKKVSRP
jgi:PEP-CTERM motif